MQQSHPKIGEPQRYNWETKKKKKKELLESLETGFPPAQFDRTYCESVHALMPEMHNLTFILDAHGDMVMILFVCLVAWLWFFIVLYLIFPYCVGEGVLA